MMDVDTDTRTLFQSTNHQAQEHEHEQQPFSMPTPRYFFPPSSATQMDIEKAKENKCTTKGTTTKTDISEPLTTFTPRENHHLPKKPTGPPTHLGRTLNARDIFLRRRAGGKAPDISAHFKKRGVSMPRYSSQRGPLRCWELLERPKRGKAERVSAPSSRLNDRLVKMRRRRRQKRGESGVEGLLRGLGLGDGDGE